MADNISISQGSGTTIATEDVSGVQHQKVKIEFGTDGVATMVSASDPLPVSATIDTTGLATDATDASVASIDLKTPPLGQALAAASVPVILPSATITTLTPQTDALTDTQLRATPVPVSGTVTANLGATDNAVLDDIASDTEAIKTSLAGTLTVTGGGGGVEYTEGDVDASITGSAIMWEDTGDTLRAVSAAKPLPISDAGGSITVDGTFYQATQPVSLASVPSHDVTNAGTFAVQATGTVTANAGTNLNTSALALESGGNLAEIKTNTDNIPAVGQALMAASTPVVIASNQSAVPVSFTGSTDVATQTTLAAINAKLVSGTDIGDVTINNASGASAVNIQDGGNTITVDYATTGSGTATGALRVELPTNGTGVVGLNAGTNNIGDVDIASIAAGDNNIGNVDIVSGTVTTVTTLTGGGIAHDSADSGNPHKIGMIAYSPDGTTPGTAVAELDRTHAKGNLDGQLFVQTEHPRWGSYHADGSTALTDATVAASPGAGFQTVITNITFSSGAATAINMFLEEGSTKIFGPIYLEAVAGRGFCTPAGFRKHVTAATAVTVTTSAAIAHSVDIQYETIAV